MACIRAIAEMLKVSASLFLLLCSLTAVAVLLLMLIVVSFIVMTTRRAGGLSKASIKGQEAVRVSLRGD